MRTGKIITLLFALMTLFSCEEASKDDPIFGSFWIGETEYIINGAFYTNRIINDSLRVNSLNLYSGFEYHPGSSTVGQLTGYGNIFEVTYMAQESEILYPGSCYFSDSIEAFSIQSCFLSLGYSISKNQGDSVRFNKGDLTISNIPEGKFIHFDFSSPGGAKLSGHYTGPVRYYKLRSDQQ